MEVKSGSAIQKRMTEFINSVYALMAAALAVTAATAYYVSTIPALYVNITEKPLILSALLIGQIIFVVVLTLAINRISFPVALTLFFGYAISLGFTLSVIFIAYTPGSIFKTFLVTAGMFGVMSVYGFITKTDLTKMGTIAFMALIGLIIGLLVNWFFKSPTIDYILSGAGVLIFTVLTAYDTQKIKQMAKHLALVEKAPMAKIAVIGALTLYLDFINLFLFMLRFMGTRREE